MKDIDLLAIGNPCADVVLKVERLPVWDDKCAGRSVGTYAGGTEANVACAISRLGRVASCFGGVGNDAHGGFLRRAFIEDKVRTDYLVEFNGAVSSSTVLFLSKHGERSLVWVSLTDESPRHDLAEAIRRSKVTYTMPYDLLALEAIHGIASRHGSLVAIDVEREGARCAGNLVAQLNACHIAFMNESGFVEAMGQQPTQSLLRSLVDRTSVQTLVVTLGSRGAMAATREASAAHPAFPVDVVDATWAGDTFNAAFLHAYLSDRSLVEMTAFACAAASRSVAVLGARNGMPTVDQVESLLRSNAIN